MPLGNGLYLLSLNDLLIFLFQVVWVDGTRQIDHLLSARAHSLRNQSPLRHRYALEIIHGILLRLSELCGKFILPCIEHVMRNLGYCGLETFHLS
jgi:hypothetical protein